MSARALFQCLTESLLHGEWWIFPDGDIHYCDGDVGDVNHETYAMQHAMGLVRNAMALDDVEGEWDSAEELLTAIRRAWTEDDATDEEWTKELDEYDIADLMAKRYNVSPGLLEVATGRQSSDPRLFAMREWGWHALRDDHAETWEITEKALQTICRGIDNALEEAGVEPEDVDPERGFWIHAYQGHRAIKLTYAQIEARDFSAHFEQPPAAPSAQVRKMDVDEQPGIYGDRLGDSIIETGPDLSGYKARAQKHSDVEQFIKALDSYMGADVLYRGHSDDATPNNSFMTDYVGHAAEYAGDSGRIDAYVYSPSDVLYFNDAQFDKMRGIYARLSDKELAAEYRAALSGHRYASEFSRSLPGVRKTLRSDIPYSQISGDPQQNDALIPLMQKYARDVHGKNIISFHGGDYGSYGGQTEFVVGDVSKLIDLRKLYAQVHGANESFRGARALIEACFIVESSDELDDDYRRVRDDVEAEWLDRKKHQSWRLVPKAKLVRFYNEYGKYGRINESLLLDIWTILHDTVLKIIVNSETKHSEEWPYGLEPDLTVERTSSEEADPNQIDLLLDDPRRELEPEPMDAEQIEKLKEAEWARWFLFVSDLSGSNRVRNFGEVKGNARYSDGSEALIKYLRAAYSAETDEARLMAIDRLLNFAHGLGSMAHWLVEGGTATLDQIAKFAPQGLTGAGLR